MSSLQPTPRPPWMQSLHALIDPDWIRMEADALLEEATSRTGLTDFGDEAFLEPYRIFVRGCEEEAQLHPLGRLLMRTDLMNWLENRLRLAAARSACGRCAESRPTHPNPVQTPPRGCAR